MFRPKKAFVLAAGMGTRMRPLTDNMPKPLIEVEGRTMIDRALDRLVEAGVTEVVVNAHYHADKLVEHLRGRDDVEITFSLEDAKYETGGGMLFAREKLGDEPVYVISTDIIWRDVNDVTSPLPEGGNISSPLLKGGVGVGKATNSGASDSTHPLTPRSGRGETNKALDVLAARWTDGLAGLLLLNEVATGYGYDGQGDFLMDARGGLKWREDGKTAPFVFTGIQMIDPRIFDLEEVRAMAPNFPLGRIYRAFLERFRGAAYDGKWYHIGTPEALYNYSRHCKEQRDVAIQEL